MTQQFLGHLFRTENIVKVDELEAPTCMICLEPYGTLDSSTGATELQVRLSCGHLVGSVCIATWLQDKNSCPYCRAAFFPAQPRPYLEDGIIDDIRPLGIHWRGGDLQYDSMHICELICEQLRLSNEVCSMAESITEPLLEKLQGQFRTPECNAAVSLYIAWHLLGPDDRVVDFLAGPSHASRIGRDQICSVYRQVYPERTDLILPEMLPDLTRLHRRRILAFLPNPDPENGISNSEEDDDPSAFLPIPPPRFVFGPLYDPRDETNDDEVNWLEVRDQLREAAADDDLGDVLETLALVISDHMDYHAELDGYSETLQRAVGAVMACHLLGVETSTGDIARVHCVSESSLHKCYGRAFRRRNELVDPYSIEVMGTGNMGRVLSALPALDWPPL